MMQRNQLLTLAEAASLLRLSRTKLYHERRSGRLRVLRFGRAVRVDPRVLDRYIRAATGTYRAG